MDSSFMAEIMQPIISYKYFLYARLFKATAIVIDLLVRDVCPDSFGLDTLPVMLQKLSAFLHQAPEDFEALSFNQDLVGFFTSIPVDRILQSIDAIISRYCYRHALQLADVVFSVLLKEKDVNLRIWRGAEDPAPGADATEPPPEAKEASVNAMGQPPLLRAAPASFTSAILHILKQPQYALYIIKLGSFSSTLTRESDLLPVNMAQADEMFAPAEQQAIEVQPPSTQELRLMFKAFGDAKDRWKIDGATMKGYYLHSESGYLYIWHQATGILYEHLQSSGMCQAVWSSAVPQLNAEIWTVLPLPPTDPASMQASSVANGELPNIDVFVNLTVAHEADKQIPEDLLKAGGIKSIHGLRDSQVPAALLVLWVLPDPGPPVFLVPLVPRSSGPVVLWSRGPLVSWSSGFCYPALHVR
ncbi:unnamed protein product [Symbiodinium natans]|uniref:Uncharacterized protein n=1 Tax=Symbiodinium natans TaxID=878477 RepID=A0A812N6L1_9DINO|nr:unnamed protein product [Symbiodinium natans]